MIAWLLALPASAQEVDGFVEARLQVSVGIDEPVPLFAIERFRPTFSAPLVEDRLLLSTTIESGLTQGWRTTQALVDLADENGVLLPESLRPPVYDNAFLAVSRASDYLAVDRLYAEIYLPAADFRIGRQAFNWGSGFAINPSDPFPEVLLTEPWRPRSGVNAVRMQVPFGDLDSFVLIAGADDAFLHPRLAGRLTVNRWNTDFSLVGAWRDEVGEGIAGVDIKGTLGVGFWFEGVVHISDDDVFEEFSTGLDYSFPVLEQLIVTLQYYRNGSGDPGRMGLTGLTQERPAFAPPFGGRDYLFGAVSAGLTRDLSSSVLWLQNLNDGTAFVVPTATLAVGSSLNLSLAAQVPVALSGGGEFRPSAQQLVVELPTVDGDVASVDFGGVVPEATLILWSRFNF